MIWWEALAFGLLAGLSRSLLVTATAAALVLPLCVVQVLTLGTNLLLAPVLIVGAIGTFNLGLIGGALTALLADGEN